MAPRTDGPGGFAPPAPLRAFWRRRAERVVREVQLRLVAAAGTDDVSHALYPFVDLLRSGYGEDLDDEGRHYLTRMSVSAMYMQDLLNDLLELSRIGRLQTEVEAVDLSILASDIGDQSRRSTLISGSRSARCRRSGCPLGAPASCSRT